MSCLQIRKKKTHSPINKCSKDLNKHFTEENSQIAKKERKKPSFHIREMQIKPTLYPTEWLKFKSLKIPNADEDAEGLELLEGM